MDTRRGSFHRSLRGNDSFLDLTLGLSSKIPGEPDGVEEWWDAEEAERTVDQTPPEGDSTNGTADECEREDECGHPDPDMENSLVADGIAIRESEEERDHEVCEGEPVRAVGDEGIVGVGDIEAFADF